MSRRKICVVTGTRADYGLLQCLMREVQNDRSLELQVVATGMHLSSEFGNTFRFIEQDGFKIDEKVEMLLASDSSTAVAKAIGLGVIGIAEAFSRLDPDIVVVLGDRFEILAAAQAALVCKLPLAHIHGGETTEGAIDESIRHAITKMAHFHFASTDVYRNRIIQMGEAPARVMNFGAPGLDQFKQMKLLSLPELERELGWKIGGPYFLVTYHPVTLSKRDPVETMHELLQALDEFPTHKILFSKSNADPGGRSIGQLIDAYQGRNSGRVFSSMSFGHLNYLSAMKWASAIIGNSSSGIIEAPTLSIPAVNIGDRQRGRIRADSTVDAVEEKSAIVEAIRKVLDPAFRTRLNGMTSPYGAGDASARIKAVLKSVALDGTLVKSFYDMRT